VGLVVDGTEPLVVPVDGLVKGGGHGDQRHAVGLFAVIFHLGMSFIRLPEVAVDIAQEKNDAAGERPMASRDPGRGPVSFSGIGKFGN
jgi:hypothetical protein